MNFERIEQRARKVAKDAAENQAWAFIQTTVKQLGFRDWASAPVELRQSLSPLKTFAEKHFEQKAMEKYFGAAEQAAINALKAELKKAEGGEA